MPEPADVPGNDRAPGRPRGGRRAAVFLTILFVTSMHPSPAFPVRGVSVMRLIGALRALGHHVELFELGAGFGGLGYVRSRKRAAKAIRALSPDVVHVHSGPCGPAARRPNVPC